MVNHKAIAQDYIRAWYRINRFWFDLVGSMPYTWFTGEVFHEGKFSSEEPSSVHHSRDILLILRFLRLLRLIRLAKLNRVVFHLETLVSSVTLSYAFMLGHLLFVVVMVAHWMACLWYFIGSSGAEDYYDTWVTVAARQGVDTPQAMYVNAIYWALATMTTVGYGDITAVSFNERVFVILAAMLASVIFAYVLGSFQGLVTKSTVESEEFRAQFISMNRYIRKYQVPETIAFKVRNFLDDQYEYDQKHHRNDEDLLGHISEALKNEIYDYVNGAALKHCPVFLSFEESCISRLSKLMEKASFSPEDIIFTEGEATTQMYIIQSGAVSIIFHRSPIQILGPNSIFGEIAFFLKVPRCATARCNAFAQLLFLQRSHLLHALEVFPSVKEKFGEVVENSVSGELSSLGVHCYQCSELGHVASKCLNTSFQRRKDAHKKLWIEKRQSHTKYINPQTTPLSPIRRNPHRKIVMKPSFQMAIGIPFEPKTVYGNTPRLQKLVTESISPMIPGPSTSVGFQQAAESWDKPKEQVRRRRPSNILEDDSSASPDINDHELKPPRTLEFRRELTRTRWVNPPILEMEQYTPERAFKKRTSARRKPDRRVRPDTGRSSNSIWNSGSSDAGSHRAFFNES